jgi:polyisoprenoid-binding protein YceI
MSDKNGRQIMTNGRHFSWGFAVLALTACGGGDRLDQTESASILPADAGTEIVETEGYDAVPDVDSGPYSLERSHAFLFFKVGHSGGISQYRVDFTDFDAQLDFNAAQPDESMLTVTVNPLALQTNYAADFKATHADSPYESWNEALSRDDRWFNADVHPSISFTSVDIVRTGERTGEVHGELTFLGSTLPVTLNVTYGGVANPPWYGGRDVIGFTAETVIQRSDFGMTALLGPIGDDVTVGFSGEFLQDE